MLLTTISQIPDSPCHFPTTLTLTRSNWYGRWFSQCKRWPRKRHQALGLPRLLRLHIYDMFWTYFGDDDRPRKLVQTYAWFIDWLCVCVCSFANRYVMWCFWFDNLPHHDYYSATTPSTTHSPRLSNTRCLVIHQSLVHTSPPICSYPFCFDCPCQNVYVAVFVVCHDCFCTIPSSNTHPSIT